MRFFILCILLIPNIASFAGNTGKNIYLADSVKEVVVYEYDTIYLAPDTIKSVDTIYTYKTKKTNWSFGAGTSVFLNDFVKETYSVDSFTVRNLFCPIPDLYLTCRNQSNIFSLRLGILPLQQNFLYEKTAYVLKGTPDDYDSLIYKTECNAKNYYTYLRCSLGYGKIWKKGSLIYGYNLFCTINYLIYKSASVKNTLFAKSPFQLEMNPFIGTKLRKNLEVYLRPFYQFTLLRKEKIPYQNTSVLGISCNLSFSF